MSKIKNWIFQLFENKPKRKRYTLLTKTDVVRLEENLANGYGKEVMMNYFNISESTYYHVKRGTHRYSTKD